MEEAVPERHVDEYDDYVEDYEEDYAEEGAGDYSDGPEVVESPLAEAPVAEEPAAVLEDESAPDPEPAPVAAAPAVEAPVAEPSIADDEAEGDGRMKAVDLIAPTRLDFLKPVEEPEAPPVDTADVFVFANQKGGVAKTTTTLNLAVAFAEQGYRVLCIDLDPQGNLTMSQGIDPDKVEKSLYDVLVNDMPISEIIVKREIDIAVASIDLAGASARWKKRCARSPATTTSSASTRRPAWACSRSTP